jgi:hypothetical protein
MIQFSIGMSSGRGVEYLSKEFCSAAAAAAVLPIFANEVPITLKPKDLSTPTAMSAATDLELYKCATLQVFAFIFFYFSSLHFSLLKGKKKLAGGRPRRRWKKLVSACTQPTHKP